MANDKLAKVKTQNRFDIIALGRRTRVWRASFACRATAHVRAAAVWTWAAESRPVRLLAAALEPPDENRRE